MKKALIACLFSLVWMAFYGQDSIYHRIVTWDKKSRSFIDEDRISPHVKEKLILFIGSSSFIRWDNIKKDFAGYNILNWGFGRLVISLHAGISPDKNMKKLIWKCTNTPSQKIISRFWMFIPYSQIIMGITNMNFFVSDNLHINNGTYKLRADAIRPYLIK